MDADEVPAEVLDTLQTWVGRTLKAKGSYRDDEAAVYEDDISYSPYRICVNGRATRDFHPHRLNLDTKDGVVTRVWRG
ncbi:hypothetical protein ACHHYP_04010 [Achlya hypogyna]|uniref:Peptidase inhibitor I78 family protein n=1 Tax=Achlya hypogyna TaxID=1202772 RepID=A0A1V9Z2D8_ACHHY|nr:hypothetical protein ACHHYP_04010 [Achlya hypogyna]